MAIFHRKNLLHQKLLDRFAQQSVKLLTFMYAFTGGVVNRSTLNVVSLNPALAIIVIRTEGILTIIIRPNRRYLLQTLCALLYFISVSVSPEETCSRVGAITFGAKVPGFRLSTFQMFRSFLV